MKKWKFSFIAGGTRSSGASEEAGWQFLKKLNTELTCDSVIPLLGLYPQSSVDRCTQTYTPMFTTALVTTSQKAETQMSVNR